MLCVVISMTVLTILIFLEIERVIIKKNNINIINNNDVILRYISVEYNVS